MPTSAIATATWGTAARRARGQRRPPLREPPAPAPSWRPAPSSGCNCNGLSERQFMPLTCCAAKTPGVDPLARCKGAIPGNTFMVASSCAEVSTCPTGYTTVPSPPRRSTVCRARRAAHPARPVTRSAASVCRGAARRWRRRPAPAIGRADGGPAGRRAGRPGAATSSSLASPGEVSLRT